jgi:serine/threonine protein kinase
MEIYMDELTQEFPFELGLDFKYIETIDHGAFGTVIHVIEISTNRDMAIKVIKKTHLSLTQIEKVKEEISILKKLNHENIVKFFGFFETNNQLLIKMEYVKYGTLSKWMKNHKTITENEASIILKQILSAVAYLHGKQICHRDIKPQNIMLSQENDLNGIKIIDFGLSAQNFDKLMNNDYCGTYIYMAPEQIEKKLYFISVDIWSIGILMFMLLNNGKHPFYVKGDNRKDFIKKIENCKINFYNKVSPMAKNLIFKLLEPNPSWRYNAAQAIKHPWITRNKNDEIPLTFNEILNKSNMKKVGVGLFGAVLFLNFLTKKKKFFINDKYVEVCNYYDEKSKIKNIRKKDRCLDALSTTEGDDSDSDLIIEKKSIDKKREINKNISLINSVQNSFIISANQAIHKAIKKKKINFVKSSKNMLRFNKVFNTDKKPQFNLKKTAVPLSLFSTKRKRVDSNNNNSKVNENTSRPHLIKICVNSNYKTKEVINRNYNKRLKKEFHPPSYSKSLRINNDFRRYKINHIYEEKTNKKEFPEIISPMRKHNISMKQYSLNDSENYNIFPLVLPSINAFRQSNILRKCIKNALINNSYKKRKSS